ncbi:TetR/AcrR family transcriptional regulator [Polaromonas sp. SM01]|nr:TetR/AcrR family transcriptional regulator [Polaromonas sp. SM01]
MKPSSSATPHARKARDAAPRPDRKQAILLAAEKLFATHGYHAVTIRQIADEAGVPLALVGYYYGQKHELFHAIFVHWSGTIEQRLAELAEAQRLPHDPHKLHRIVEAFIGPVLRLRASPEGEYYARLVSQGLSVHSEVGDPVLREFFDPLAHAFIAALQQTLSADSPSVTRSTVAWCYQFALGALLHHIHDQRVTRLSGGDVLANDPAAAPLLVAFIVHGMRGVITHAAVPLPPSAKKRRQP